MNNGVLGEAKVLTYFVENGYNVYTPFDGHSPFDLVVYKDGILQRVSVKSTQRLLVNRWKVSIGQSQWRIADNKRSYAHAHFDKATCDILAIYIIPEDRIVLLDIDLVHGKSVVGIPKLHGDA